METKTTTRGHVVLELGCDPACRGQQEVLSPASGIAAPHTCACVRTWACQPPARTSATVATVTVGVVDERYTIG